MNYIIMKKVRIDKRIYNFFLDYFIENNKILAMHLFQVLPNSSYINIPPTLNSNYSYK